MLVALFGEVIRSRPEPVPPTRIADRLQLFRERPARTSSIQLPQRVASQTVLLIS